jgi:hypothetical protein
MRKTEFPLNSKMRQSMNILNLLSRDSQFSHTDMVAINERRVPFSSKISLTLEVHPSKIYSFRRVVLPKMEAIGGDIDQKLLDGVWQISCQVDRARWRDVTTPTRSTILQNREMAIYFERVPLFETVDLYIEIARAPRKFFKEVVRPAFQRLGIILDNPTNQGRQCGNQARWRLTGRVPADRWQAVSCGLEQAARSLHPKLIRHWHASCETMAA